MKKVILSVLVISSLFACKKKADLAGCMDPNSFTYNSKATIDDGSCQFPIQEQSVLVMEYTSTGCGACGGWGSQSIHAMAEEDNVYPMVLHVGGPMKNSIFDAFVQQRPYGGSVPTFYIGDTKSNSAYTLAVTKQNIPEAALVGKAETTDENIILDIQTTFFESVQGDYYVGAYLLESGIDGGESSGSYNQSGVTGDYEHDYVLRKSFASEAFGEQLPSSAISKGSEYLNNFQLPLKSVWNIDNCHVLIVVWKKDNADVYNFVNVNKVNL